MSQAIGGVSNITLLCQVTCKTKGRTSSHAKGKTVKVVKSEKDKQKMKKNGGFGEKKKEPLWQCIQGCGACCKLGKGPSFATPEEIFDNPSDIELYKSLVGTDGWCKHFDKITKTCSIYVDRPYFCRVEPDVFQSLYGINKKSFNKEACSFCKDTIKAIYGADSEVLDRFNKAVRRVQKLVSDRIGEVRAIFFIPSAAMEDDYNHVWIYEIAKLRSQSPGEL